MRLNVVKICFADIKNAVLNNPIKFSSNLERIGHKYIKMAQIKIRIIRNTTKNALPIIFSCCNNNRAKRKSIHRTNKTILTTTEQKEPSRKFCLKERQNSFSTYPRSFRTTFTTE